MNKRLAQNVIVGFGGQFLVLVLGIIVPRVIITNYGSDINGVIGTITQIFTYLALLEAGVGQAARNALYKPIINNDREEVSHIVSISRNYFRKLTILYGLGVCVLACTVPFLLKSDVDKATICLVVVFQGLSGVITFYFIQTQTIILGVDGRGYVNSIINVVNQILGYVVRIILAFWGANIALLQFIYLLITIVKIFVYRDYFKKNYGWIDYTCAHSNEKFEDRNAYIITEIAWTIFSSTDMIVLSAFVSTQLSSVYSIYNMVFSSLNVLLNAVYSSIVYVLGQSFYESKEKYIKIHDTFTSTFLGAMTVLMCVTYILILPFVRLYTSGVNDVEYIYPSLPLMFCMVQIISWSRYVAGNLTTVAGYAKSIVYVSLMEAMVNVFLSIILVRKFGIAGVVFATVVALPLKVIYCVYLSDKKILRRSCKKTVKILAVNYGLFVVTVLTEKYLKFEIMSYFDFIKYATIISFILGIIGATINVIANKECIVILKQMRNKN